MKFPNWYEVEEQFRQPESEIPVSEYETCAASFDKS
jgi:hypothetical protein